MKGKEIVRKAIEFDNPPRLPFFIGSLWKDNLSECIQNFPNDVCDSWEMDRHKAGWYFNNPVEDDWGCIWRTIDQNNMGQVVYHPLDDWSKLDTYKPPNPRDEFYFERIEEDIKDAQDRYVVVTSHFNLIERLEMLHGFARTYEDFYFEPEKVHHVLDMILEYKINQINELGRRFGDRVNGIFLTDDWGTQQSTLVSSDIFKAFFFDRYRQLFKEVHNNGWHVIFHSCGRINDFVPFLIELSVDVLNIMQPHLYGLKELGQRFAGKVCFLSTADIQATLPQCDPDAIQAEAEELVKYWSTPKGGFIVFNYGASEAIGTTDEMSEIMFSTFYDMREYWKDKS
ncbi:MAG: uroporphyrinogen decarboxylase family protein [Planctomycetota bacterium]|jgi:hypothetical protein